MYNGGDCGRAWFTVDVDKWNIQKFMLLKLDVSLDGIGSCDVSYG